MADFFAEVEKFADAGEKELQAIEGVGPVVATAIIEWFKDRENQKLFERLLKQVKIETTQHLVSNRFFGLSFVLTGTLKSISREEAKERIRELGGEVRESVSKNTSYVIVGAEAGEKLKKAEELGVKILNEKEFFSLIDKS